MEGLIQEPKSGCYYRPEGTDDLDIIKEGNSVYAPLAPLWPKGGTALDLGAHIGTFVRRALRNGVRHVVAIEAEADNYRVLNYNALVACEDFGGTVTARHAAVANHTGDAILYVNDGKGKCMHSVVTKGQKRPVRVQAVALDDLLAEFKPPLLKVDIECAEYGLDRLRDLPDYVRVLVMELHLNGKMRQQGVQLANDITAQGFTAIRAPHFTRANWHTVPVWRR